MSSNTVGLDIRETSRPANRMALDDPRLNNDPPEGGELPVRNKLLVWHNQSVDQITFDIVKYPEVDDTYYKITQRENWNSDFPVKDVLSTSCVTKTYTVDEDSDYHDLRVTYGNSTGNNEDFGPYSIYGVTAEEFAESRNNFWHIYLRIMVDFADAIYRRFADGHWNNTSTTWRPTSTVATARMNAKRVTHNFGATFIENPPVTINGKKYPDADVIMPIYYWDNTKPTNDLIRESGEFEAAISYFINNKISYTELEAAYNAAGGGNPRTVRFNFTGDNNLEITFGPNLSDISICLGYVNIDSSLSYYGSGYIDLSVTKNSDTSYTIAANPTINATIEDVFDFNYFTESLGGRFFDAPQSGAMIQCAHGRPGVDSGVGQVALIKVDLDGTVDVGPFTKTE